MKLRGIDFGPICSASGAQGWFGEGYPYHRFVPNLNFDGCTFTAKTTTLNARKGNMPLTSNWAPQGLTPKCVKVKFFKGVVLNAVGLSGPGATELLASGNWQRIDKPFFLSFMSILLTKEERLKELRDFANRLQLARVATPFKARFALQWNISCPNVGLHQEELVDEVKEGLNILEEEIWDVPIVLKVNVLFPFDAALEIASLDACDAFCVSNTLPWGKMPDQVDWKGLFGSNASPLEKLGFAPGGLSGAPLFPLVKAWVTGARASGLDRPINAGGGILCADDVTKLRDAGASSVFVGSVAILRGWRVPAIIKRAHALMWQE